VPVVSLNILGVDMSSTYTCYEFEILSHFFVTYFNIVDDNVLMRSLVICTPYPILCGW